jgi:uncharacterized protein YecT (DUF1311 family)
MNAIVSKLIFQSVRKIAVLSFAISLVALDAQVSAEKKYPIDIKLEQWLAADSNQTTNGMVKCIRKAEKEWDGELNRYYQLLMKNLDTDSRHQLKTTQRHWLKYRDSEFKFQAALWRQSQGTIWKLVYAEYQMQFVRQRVIWLMQYYDDKTNN